MENTHTTLTTASPKDSEKSECVVVDLFELLSLSSSDYKTQVKSDGTGYKVEVAQLISEIFVRYKSEIFSARTMIRPSWYDD